MSLSVTNDSIKPVVILGAGGHAKVVMDMLTLAEREILCFVVPEKKPEDYFYGYKILQENEFIDKYSPENIVLANGIGSLPKENQRWLVAENMRKKGYCFMSIAHPSAVIADDVKLSEGVQIMAGVVIQSGSEIGRDTIINTGALIDHDCKISDKCHIAPGVVCSGGVQIGQRTHIGTGASIIQNISIGEDTIVAAGSVVYKDVSTGTTLI